jgi:predicted TIM-barrel enzyme
MELTFCTLTGVDENTPLGELSSLSNRYPVVEWGFLYSPKRQGQPGRYPSVEYLRMAFSQLPAHVNVALHVCGDGVRQLIYAETFVTELVRLVEQRGGRVQLNFNAHRAESEFSLAQVRACIARYPGVQFITQYNTANAHVWEELKDLSNHSVLFDASGGNGISPSEWMPPLKGVACGYAGGLGPDNVDTELARIHAVTGNAPFSIDMEGKLRDRDDCFNRNAAKAVLDAVTRHIRNLSPKVYPVIHFLDRDIAFSEAQKALDAGADGIFLINHQGDDMELLSVACAIKVKHPQLPVGVNFLSMTGLDAAIMARKFGLPMVWGDDVGVDSKGLTDLGLSVQAQKVAGADDFGVFASVAFKYRPHEPNPELAAKNALAAGFIPTTSGSGTGSAPELDKIITMSKATGGVLAVASGMTPENVADFAPYLSHVLVATGVAIDEHRMDVDKLKLLIANSKVKAHAP